MATIENFPFFPLHFDDDGKLTKDAEQMELVGAAAAATDVLFLAHGFRNSVDEATDLYAGILKSFRAHVDHSDLHANLSARKFVVAGVYWPSKAFKESGDTGHGAGNAQGLTGASAAQEEQEKKELDAQLADLEKTVACPEQKPKLAHARTLVNTADVANDSKAQDEIVAAIMSLLDDIDLGKEEGAGKLKKVRGKDLLHSLEKPLVLKSSKPAGNAAAIDLSNVHTGGTGGAQGLKSFFGSIFGRIGTVANIATWYVMKSRSGTVGESLAPIVAALKQSAPQTRVHLAGHSLGGRLMAACANQLAKTGGPQLDSMTLLEAAFSHYGFSPDNGFSGDDGKPLSGRFRAVVDKKIVKGPLVATYSDADTTVGKVYAIASRLSGDNAQALGDKNDQYGGIGRNGAQKTAEAVDGPLHKTSAPYALVADKVLCFDGSGGLIKDHSDVKNPEVVYLLASAVAATK